MQRVALMAALAFTLAGCAGAQDKQLSQDEARDAAAEAMATFARDFAAADGGDLRLVRGEFDMQVPGGLAGDVTFEMEWGAQDRSRVSLLAGGGGQTIDAQVFCSKDRVILAWGDHRFEQRATQGSCLAALQDGSDPLSVAALGNDTIQRVDAHRDGRVTAYMSKDGNNVTAHVDARGRLTRMDFSGEGGGGTLHVDYGQRKPIQVPEASQRLPARVEGSGHYAGGQYTWTAQSATQAMPMEDVEVRVVDDGGDVVTAFLLRAGQQSRDGFALTFTDDGDGLFGQGDRFVVESGAWTSPGQYDVVLWDTWADAEVGDVPIPGWSWVVLVGALAVAARRP